MLELVGQEHKHLSKPASRGDRTRLAGFAKQGAKLYLLRPFYHRAAGGKDKPTAKQQSHNKAAAAAVFSHLSWGRTPISAQQDSSTAQINGHSAIRYGGENEEYIAHKVQSICSRTQNRVYLSCTVTWCPFFSGPPPPPSYYVFLLKCKMQGLLIYL